MFLFALAGFPPTWLTSRSESINMSSIGELKVHEYLATPNKRRVTHSVTHILVLHVVSRCASRAPSSRSAFGILMRKVQWSSLCSTQVANTRPAGRIHLVLSGLAPCFYLAAVPSSRLTVKE